ncbi:hypothetical protein G3A_07550 [Bacillus sp. 17376]|uniref:Uncharacterized protein n=1 Tax=Mesobacillus boroniphilus JCM 21738 TaxID=1294265 RepID=W4RK21_9BACI|nr:hypothetical protein [Mesobacillus boroniphilus]ESU33218.1 hypothetical protein G3A_07550 [Bacillus sp. 17376]GAE44477.1 hypothetical protein JCM21738_1192 [Mesobacillus boroniphilus JCM 21738]
MDKGSLMISFIGMAIAILYSTYHLFISKKTVGLEQEVEEEIKARPIANVIRYLIFLAINSFLANMFFDIGWLLWISFFSAVALWIMLVEHQFNFSYLISIIIILLIFLGAAVPKHQQSFLNHISDHTEYNCFSIECVKVSQVVIYDELKTEIETYSIQGYSFDWYLLFAKGALLLKDEQGNMEEFTGVNIGGLWLLEK